ncbi:unnamed protein product [Amoebophrya sp. A120]|nr:unnamed protein product [Amoebophrya sp. A120]|eukprot:GSA120T00022414001.1
MFFANDLFSAQENFNRIAIPLIVIGAVGYFLKSYVGHSKVDKALKLLVKDFYESITQLADWLLLGTTGTTSAVGDVGIDDANIHPALLEKDLKNSKKNKADKWKKTKTFAGGATKTSTVRVESLNHEKQESEGEGSHEMKKKSDNSNINSATAERTSGTSTDKDANKQEAVLLAAGGKDDQATDFSGTNSTNESAATKAKKKRAKKKAASANDDEAKEGGKKTAKSGVVAQPSPSGSSLSSSPSLSEYTASMSLSMAKGLNKSGHLTQPHSLPTPTGTSSGTVISGGTSKDMMAHAGTAARGVRIPQHAKQQPHQPAVLQKSSLNWADEAINEEEDLEEEGQMYLEDNFLDWQPKFREDMEPLPDWVFEYAKQVKSSDLRSLMLLSDAGFGGMGSMVGGNSNNLRNNTMTNKLGMNGGRLVRAM